MDSINSKDRRKHRKLLVDKKKSNVMSTISVGNYLSKIQFNLIVIHFFFNIFYTNNVLNLLGLYVT